MENLDSSMCSNAFHQFLSQRQQNKLFSKVRKWLVSLCYQFSKALPLLYFSSPLVSSSFLKDISID